MHISDSYLSTGDDCIAIKSGRDAQGRRVGRPVENVTITNCTMVRGHGGVSIGSEMAGGARRIAVSNCVFQDTERGIRIKTTRGRGNVVEDVQVTNIVVRDLKHEAVALDMFYTAAPPEPVSERTPHVRNVHISGITGHGARERACCSASTRRGIDDVTLTDIDVTAETGLIDPERRPRDAAGGPHPDEERARPSSPRTPATCACSTSGRWPPRGNAGRSSW